MDAVELPHLGVSKIFAAKGFVREGVVVGGAEMRHPNTVMPPCGSLGSGSVVLGLNTTRLISKEKTRGIRQKNGLDGKRSDKRNFKAPGRNKFDSFFSKNGLSGGSSCSGGNNILGIYGLKSEIHAVTKRVDELSLEELFDGSNRCPNVCQDKGKKGSNTSENILHLVRRACSVLQPPRTLPSQNAVELDAGSSKKTDTYPLSSSSCGTSGINCNNGDIQTAEKTLSCKMLMQDHKKPGPARLLDTSMLKEPKDMLECLALQPAKDLDSLLLDTSKPAVPSRSTAPIPRRDRLPPFSWSHSFNGPCKANVDMGKLANRGMYQSRWVRIGTSASSHGDDTCSFSDLDVCADDRTLVHSQLLKLGLSAKEKSPLVQSSHSWCEQVSSSSAHLESQLADKNIIKSLTAMNLNHPLKFGLPHKSQGYFDSQLKYGFNMGIYLNDMKGEDSKRSRENDVVSLRPLKSNVQFRDTEEQDQCKGGKYACSSDPENSKRDQHSPRLIAAAQILHEIAGLPSIRNESSVKIRWPKRPSQKSMKARRKSRSPLRKPEPTSIPPKSVTVSDDHISNLDRSVPSKKPRFFQNNQRTDTSQVNNVVRGPMKWSTPTSSRSSPSRIDKGLITDTKRLHTDPAKFLGTMPSSSRVLDKTNHNPPQKLRKPLFIDWGRGRNKKE